MTPRRFYRPQRSWAKVMFLQASVILSTRGVCLSACWDTTPWEQTSPREQTPAPPVPDPPGDQTPWGPEPPGADTPPLPGEADASIRSMSGRYASYWNAFLLFFNFT